MKMKTNRILAAALLAASLASCTQKLQFNDVPFAAFDSVVVATTEIDGAVDIAVTATSCTKAFSVVFEVIENTAKTGVNFEILDNDAQVLTFTPQNPTQIIKVGIIDLSGTFTGDTSFSLKLASATEGVNLSGNTVCKVSIKDFDHPLAAMLGDYNGVGSDAYGSALSFPLSVTPDESDTYKVWFEPIVPFLYMNGISGFSLSVYGTVSPDMKTITIPFFQLTKTDAADLFGGTSGNYMQLVSWAIESDAVVIVDSGITSFKFEWNDSVGGYVNDTPYTLAGANSGKLGNYYYLYIPKNGLAFKKK